MPKQPVDFNNTVFYKIFCKDENIKDVYVGRTTDFIRRKFAHKQKCKTNSIHPYTFINMNGGWDNWNIEIIEKYPCSNSIDANDREQHWINLLEATLNTQIKFSNVEYKKEWYFKNRERIRVQQELSREKRKQTKIERQQYLESLKIDYDNIECNPEWFLNNVKHQKCIK
jgi:hypothetical protein